MKRILPVLAAFAASVAFSSRADVDLTGAVQMSAGPFHSCAVTDAGALYCWGANESGQLGDNTTNADITTHRRAVAAPVFGLSSGVAMVSTGGTRTVSHTCAVTTEGAAKCWGANDAGQLGDGTTMQRLTPVDVAGLGSGVLAISAGGQHTCALVTGGGIKCWGANGAGELGDGTNTPRLTPVDVSGLTSGVSQVSAAYLHTCAVQAGAARCWGSNNTGQLGDGTTTNRNAPVAVLSLESSVASIETGRLVQIPLGPATEGGVTCAVTTTGGAKCWGTNNSGVLGNGSTTNSLTPFDVTGMTSGVAAIAIGFATLCEHRNDPPGLGLIITYHRTIHACGLKTDGSVHCWGGNNNGELGSPRPPECGANFSTTPYPSFLTSGGSSISAGSAYSCALRNDTDRVTCWGAYYGDSGSFVRRTDSGLIPQTITLGPTPTGLDPGEMATLTATGGGSGNPVVLTSLTPSVCTVSGNTITGAGNGICTIAANQAGNASYDPAPQVTTDFPVGAPFAQTITFGAAPTIVVGGTGTVSATASSGLTVTFTSNTPSICTVSGSVVTGVAEGTCTIAASQSGDSLYAPAPQVTQNIIVTSNAASVADLAVSGTGNPATVTTGRDVMYTFTLSNAAGGGNSASVVLTYEFTSQAVFVWASAGCAPTSATVVTCSYGTLNAGQSAQAKIVIRPVSAGSMMSAAHVSGSLPEPSYANNRAIMTTSVTTAPAAFAVSRYRLYSDASKEHLFTTDLNEYNVLGASGNWVQEGTVGKVLDNPGSFNGVEATPYYRLYNTATTWHHWTTDPNEYYTLIQYPGWNAESVDGWILPTNTAGATELFRLNYPAIPGLHHWTIDPVEYNQLITVYGWVGEGGSGFVVQ